MRMPWSETREARRALSLSGMKRLQESKKRRLTCSGRVGRRKWVR